MKWLALLAILLIIPSALAATVSVDIFGTNASNAQSNITKTGNNSYNVSIWNTGDNTKTVLVSINGNASDSITFTLHNFTARRVIEVKVNSSAFNAYQADSTGTISFTRTQTVRNQTYSFTAALQAGGYNTTWAQFWTWPSLFGVNFTQHLIPYSGATADLNMNNYNITNVSDIQSTTTNITILNATSMIGNGLGITRFNASNATNVLPNASAPVSSVNYSHARMKAVVYGKNMAEATVNTSYTGAGFRPNYIKITAIYKNQLNSSTTGINSDLSFGTIYQLEGGTVIGNASSGGYIVYLSGDTGQAQQAGIISIDPDGITLEWSKVGSPTGTGHLLFEYYR